ncbi:hypothetical protein SCA6_014713 [Theobroma cacao]
MEIVVFFVRIGILTLFEITLVSFSLEWILLNGEYSSELEYHTFKTICTKIWIFKKQHFDQLNNISFEN